MSDHCPTCGSPRPDRHPAVQFEGEVQLCEDPWHKPSATEIRSKTHVTPPECFVKTKKLCAGFTALRLQAELMLANDSLIAVPIDMIIFCPKCGMQHVDAPSGSWENPPHKSHLCHGCNWVWRHADVPTNGVAEIATTGKNDSPKSRGRLPAVLAEQLRIEALIDSMLPFEGPRMLEAKRNLMRAIRRRG